MPLRARRWTVAVTAAAVLATTVVQAASGVPGAAPAGAQDPVTRNLVSTCEFPVAGAQPATIGITATFPVLVPAGTGVAATDVAARLVLPEPTVAALRAAGARSVEGIAYLDLAVTYPDKAATAQTGLEITARPLPEAGELLVEGPGVMDPVPADGPGDLVFAVGAPWLALVLRTEDGGQVTGDPNAVLPCTPEPDQDRSLATVRVTAPDEAGTTTSRPPPTNGTSSSPGGSTTDPGTPAGTPGAPQQPPSVMVDPVPHPCGPFEVPSDAKPVLRAIVYFHIEELKATVKKLGSEVVFEPGWLIGSNLFWVRIGPKPDGKPGTATYFCQVVFGDYLLSPALGSFTIFRFVPSTSQVTIVPIAGQPSTRGFIYPFENRFVGTSVTNMKLSDVRVGGTPLDVGTNCQTATPLTIDLRAEFKDFNLLNGGVLEADFTIPEFAGCGVREPLDTLLTNLVSGPGNHIRIKLSPMRNCLRPTPPVPPACSPNPTGGR